jgi:hypothetical protein
MAPAVLEEEVALFWRQHGFESYTFLLRTAPLGSVTTTCLSPAAGGDVVV